MHSAECSAPGPGPGTGPSVSGGTRLRRGLVDGVSAEATRALAFAAVVTTPSSTASLETIDGEKRPLEEWVTTFHLVLVALDPYTHESAWIIDTAGRVLRNFVGADCRVGWLVTADAEAAAGFLGPWSDELITFVDPDRSVVTELGIETLPAIVHLDHGLQVVGRAEGWIPGEWKRFAADLADDMSWSRPQIPAEGDPTPYAGTPVGG